MTAAVERAYRLQRWVVVKTWSPHWMFSRWQRRYLEGRRRVLTVVQTNVFTRSRVASVGRDFPKAVVDLITRMYLPLDESQDTLAYAVEQPVPEAVKRCIEQHPSRIEYWLTGAP